MLLAALGTGSYKEKDSGKIQAHHCARPGGSLPGVFLHELVVFRIALPTFWQGPECLCNLFMASYVRETRLSHPSESQTQVTKLNNGIEALAVTDTLCQTDAVCHLNFCSSIPACPILCSLRKWWTCYLPMVVQCFTNAVALSGWVVVSQEPEAIPELAWWLCSKGDCVGGWLRIKPRWLQSKLCYLLAKRVWGVYLNMSFCLSLNII